MNTLPTSYVSTIGCSTRPPGCKEDEISMSVPHGTVYPGRFILIEQPVGLVLVREDCGNRYCVNGKIVATTDAYDNPLGYAPCPTCLGAPLLAWYRVCDCGCHRTNTIHYDGKTCCVDVDGRRLVKVRRTNEQIEATRLKWGPNTPRRCVVCGKVIWPLSGDACEATVGWTCSWGCWDRVASFGEPQDVEGDE